jgi:AcrR family transcriptional regulator
MAKKLVKKSLKVKRVALSADAIAEAALALADAQGMDGFSFRNLAKVLRCEAMSIYHYYPSKAHLLDAMVAICLNELKFADKTAPWPQQLRHAARIYRAMALRHPGFFPFMAVYRMNSMEGLTTLNELLQIFELTGLDTETRARHFRVFGYYLVGVCLDETIGYVKGPSSADPVPGDVAAQKFPSIISVGRYFGKDQHERTFAVGLAMIMAAIEREAAAVNGVP